MQATQTDSRPKRVITTLPAPAAPASEILVISGRPQDQTATGADGPVLVKVNPQAAATLEKQRASLTAAGMVPYFDFDQVDYGASFWPEEFLWREAPEPGVYCRGTWSDEAKARMQRGSMRLLIAIFHVTGDGPATIISHPVQPVMGSLSIGGAKQNVPVRAKYEETDNNDNNDNNMNDMNQLIAHNVREQLRGIGGVRVLAESPRDILKSYGAVLAKNASLPLTEKTAELKASLANEAAAIYAADIARNPMILGMNMHDAIKAADFTDPQGNLGLLSGSMVMQQTLPLMIGENPILSAISTDFSAEVGQFKRTENTRIVLKPAVQTYDDTPDSGGRPAGWTVASQGQTIDIPVTMSDYIGVPLVFGVATLGATPRRLFDESSPLAIAAIGDYAVAKLSALMTPANFNGYKGNSATGGATTSGSAVATMTSTANCYNGQEISGTGIPSKTYIRSVDSSTQVTLTKAATATGSSLTFTLNGGRVPTTYATYAKALASWAVADLDTLAGALDTNEVPKNGRFAALLPAYYRALGSDAAVNALMQATGDPSYLTERRLPKISNFELLNSSWMPSANNQVGFVGHKAALVLKTRLPQDLSKALAGVQFPGSTLTVTDPNTGLSMLLVQYIDPRNNYAEWRPEIMLGTAVGDRRAGLVLTSA